MKKPRILLLLLLTVLALTTANNMIADENNGDWIRYGGAIIGCGGSGSACKWSLPKL